MNFVKDTAGNWSMSDATGSSLSATTAVAEDPGMVALAKPYHAAALQYLQTPIGQASGDFLANGQTVKDTALMDLVNKVQMYYGHAQLSVAAPFSPTAKIPQGTVTIGDVSSVYVYENFLFTINITGAQLRKYMEMSVGRYYKTYQPGDIAVQKNNVPDYNLDLLQGADYTVDLTKIGLFDANGAAIAAGEPRITKLQVNGKDVVDTDTFTLALNNYRVNGGGGFLAAAGIVPQSTDPTAPNYITYDSQKELGDDGQIRSLMIRYFQDVAKGEVDEGKTEVEPADDNNWQTVPRFYDFVEFTDTHGNIDNYVANNTVKANAALLAGAVNKERALYGDDRTVVLAAGDMMQGTPISNVLKGGPVIDIMRQMKFDAMELGNHEFDWGNDVLDQNLTKAGFPFLAANLGLKPGDTDVNAQKLSKAVQPYTILTKDGLKVGVIGVILPDVVNIVMPSIIGHFAIQDPVQTVNQLVPQLKAQGADMVVVLAHIGDQYNAWPSTGTQPAVEPLSQDLAKLAKGITGVSAVFGGHSHTTNYDMVPDAAGKMIPAVIGYANGRGAGVIRLALDANNAVVGAAPNYLDVSNRLYSTLTPDPQVQAIVDAANAQIGPVFSQVIGRAEVDMTRNTASSGNLDSNLGDWATDVTKDGGKADFAFQNSGGLRIDIPQGDITVGEIWQLMPFDNEINVMDMTGAQVKVILEYMTSGIKGMGHISGLRFSYDPNKPARFVSENGKIVENPANSRVTGMTTSDGKPIDLAKVYKVAAPDFIATGGDNYPFPANSTNLVATHVLVRDALLNDLTTRQVLNYQPDGRIVIYAPAEVSSNLGNRLIAGQVKNFAINTVANSEATVAARIKVTLANPKQSSSIKLRYLDNKGKYHPLNFDKSGVAWYGPDAGFALNDNSYKFSAEFKQIGIYGYKVELVRSADQHVLAVETEQVSVYPCYVRPGSQLEQILDRILAGLGSYQAAS
ncbi:MAG: 5'-nucleotidase C-terminal domain-containing protein [Peptococcaceae bacterium]|nr:5'-nucleotidase C-terminal domain-containing protein [Peptococcaceae bacterium]